jgi:hypothetical protein
LAKFSEFSAKFPAVLLSTVSADDKAPLKMIALFVALEGTDGTQSAGVVQVEAPVVAVLV